MEPLRPRRPRRGSGDARQQVSSRARASRPERAASARGSCTRHGRGRLLHHRASSCIARAPPRQPSGVESWVRTPGQARRFPPPRRKGWSVARYPACLIRSSPTFLHIVAPDFAAGDEADFSHCTPPLALAGDGFILAAIEAGCC